MAASARWCTVQATPAWTAAPGGRRRPAVQFAVRALRKDADSGDEPPPAQNRLAATIKRKQQEVGAQIQELGQESLEERLKSATKTPAFPDHRLARLVAETVPTGRPVLVLELARGPGAEDAEQLRQLAAAALAAGADALCVKTDSDDTPEPLKDLLAVTQAAADAGPRGEPGSYPPPQPAPVLQRDWFLHPIQVVGAKEAGAAGIIGTIASVTGRGTPLMSSFAAAIGLDCPVEVVNMQELKAMEQFKVPFYGINLSVGLSVQIKGFGLQVAEGLLEQLPFGAISMIGVRSVGEARKARIAGADCLLIKHELVRQHVEALPQLVEALRDATNFDD